MMIFEYEQDLCRINFRSSGNYVINKIAEEFGGGGHAFAAGAKVSGHLNDVIKTVLNKTITEMQNQESTK
jgi:phosphoesterase RecJ-like protein